MPILIMRSFTKYGLPFFSITKTANKPDNRKNRGIHQLLMKLITNHPQLSSTGIFSIWKSLATSGIVNKIGAWMTNPIIIANALKKSKLCNRDIFNLSFEILRIKKYLSQCQRRNYYRFIFQESLTVLSAFRRFDYSEKK